MGDPSLQLVVLKTNDVDALRAFYSRIGFRFIQEQHGNGPQHFSAPLGDGILEIYPLPDGAESDWTTRLGFGVTDVASVLDLLGDGAKVSGPKQTEWGRRAIVRDPDGRSIELYESA